MLIYFVIEYQAQKPWAKLLNKVNKTKQDYFNACKNERSITNQERNASGDTSLSPDQVFSFFYRNFDFDAGHYCLIITLYCFPIKSIVFISGVSMVIFLLY